MMRNLRRARIAGLMSLILVLFTGVAANAYHLEPAKWSGQPSPGMCCAHIKVGIESTSSSVTAAWSNGIYAWNISAAPIVYDQPSSYKVGLAQINDSSNSSDGHVTYYYAFGYFYSMSGWLNYAYIKNYSSSEAQGVAAHELGHVAGLAHTNGCVLMTPQTSTRQSCGIHGPVTDDINGILSLY